MNNAVIYARFSSQSQDEQTIEVQKKACYDFAERHGYSVIDVYVDEAKTGRNENRPAFKKMLQDSENGNFQFVIVYKYDRFARNMRLSLNSEAELNARGIITLSTIEPYSDDANGKLMRGMNYLIAEFYSNDYAQRIKKGLENSASKCQTTGGQRTLGYKSVDKKYVIDEKEAIAVKRIFEMYADGEKMSNIIDYLNEQGFKTAKQGSFNKNSLHRILTNKRYIGTYIFKDLEVPNKIPRIISNELFEEVQKKMNSNCLAPARARAKTEYLLTTKLYCGHCKGAMVGSSGTSRNKTLHTYYICKNAKNRICDKKSIQKDYIEDLVVDELRKFLTDRNIEMIANNVIKLYEQQKDMYIIRGIKNSIESNKKKMDNLITSVAETDDDKIRKLLFEKISDLEKLNAGLEKELAKEQKKQLNISVDDIKYFLTDLRSGYINNIRYRKTLINALVNRIYLYDHNMIIAINTQKQGVEIDMATINDMENVLIKEPMLHQILKF